jgi:hypothetical protein
LLRFRERVVVENGTN